MQDEVVNRVMRPPNWKLQLTQLTQNTQRLQAVSARVLEETDEHARFKLFCLADSLLDQRNRITVGPTAK